MRGGAAVVNIGVDQVRRSLKGTGADGVWAHRRRFILLALMLWHSMGKRPAAGHGRRRGRNPKTIRGWRLRRRVPGGASRLTSVSTDRPQGLSLPSSAFISSWCSQLEMQPVRACDSSNFLLNTSWYIILREALSNHDGLMSNFFAQSDALAYGKTFKGNRPVSFLLSSLSAYEIGQFDIIKLSQINR